MIFRGDNTAYCVLFAFELFSYIKNTKEQGGLSWNEEYHPFFCFFFNIFSQNRRKNLSLNTEYILFFPRPVYMDGQERKLPSFILLIWTSWIQLILVSHEWGMFKHLSLTTENLQIQILCQTWLSSLAQMNLNSYMTQQYECHWPRCQWGTKCTAPCDNTPIKSRHCALFSI